MGLYEEMLAVADEGQVEGLSRFFKTGPGQYGEGDRFLGIKVPVTRAVVKACWRDTDWKELERCMASEYHEVRLAALLTLVELFSKTGAAKNYFSQGFAKNQFSAAEGVRRQCVEFYLAHTEGINNWDLVDLSCYPLLGVWLLDKDRSLLYELARNGRTIWEQRIGIVSTMTFVRHGQLQDTFNIADILLHHPHDLIHKAVGWLLREAGKRDKPALEAYLQETPDQVGGDDGLGHPVMPAPPDQPVMPGPPDQPVMPGPSQPVMPGSSQPVMPGSDRASLPRYKQMPRTMLRYAIEKFPERERQAYLRGEV